MEKMKIAANPITGESDVRGFPDTNTAEFEWPQPTIPAPNDRQIGGSHYQAELQHWDLIEIYGIGYVEGNATKYLARWAKKNGRQDLEKALHYTEKTISLLEQNHRRPRGVVPSEVIRHFVEVNKIDWKSAVALRYLLRWESREDLDLARVAIKSLIEELPA